KGSARFAGVKTVCHGANVFISVAVASIVRGMLPASPLAPYHLKPPRHLSTLPTAAYLPGLFVAMTFGASIASGRSAWGK
ncbi:MAG: hypothetical protein WCC41_16905, partial [Rhodomicrobium sp.]